MKMNMFNSFVQVSFSLPDVKRNITSLDNE